MMCRHHHSGPDIFTISHAVFEMEEKNLPSGFRPRATPSIVFVGAIYDDVTRAAHSSELVTIKRRKPRTH
jgi:hypothetical protein